MRYTVLGDEETVLAFSLVGIEGVVVRDSEDAREAFTSSVGDPDVGIVLITERTAELIRPLVDERIFVEQFPLVLEIPDRQGPIEGKLSLREMVNQAIGISV